MEAVGSIPAEEALPIGILRPAPTGVQFSLHLEYHQIFPAKSNYLGRYVARTTDGLGEGENMIYTGPGLLYSES